ncbi:hypothetical protein BDL97_07G083100 [Sphagnum fallax]|nr:hypothetical protein BDL97_07G083100 [Sphagnum fallax]
MTQTTQITLACLLVLLLLVESSCATSRRVSAPAAEEPLPIKCDASVLELVPCSDSLSGKRAVARPDHRCCVALKELMLTPECLCFAASTAHGFNKKQVLSLPSACHIRIKPGQTCDGLPVPTTKLLASTPL